MSLLERLRSAMALVRRFLAERRGVSTVEYALIVVAVIAILAAVSGEMGDAFNTLFEDLADELEAGMDEAGDAGDGSGGATTGGGSPGTPGTPSTP